MEPDWNEVRERLMALTMRELRPLKSGWFNGLLGGASGKTEVVSNMVSQMRHWWNVPDMPGQARVKNILKDLRKIEEGTTA